MRLAFLVLVAAPRGETEFSFGFSEGLTCGDQRVCFRCLARWNNGCNHAHDNRPEQDQSELTPWDKQAVQSFAEQYLDESIT